MRVMKTTDNDRLAEELIEKMSDWEEIIVPFERSVIKLRLGLDGQNKHTFELIGQVFNISTGRIVNIYKRAIRKLEREFLNYKKEDKEVNVITLEQLKLLAEAYTHVMRSIDPNCASVKLIDRFVKQVEDYVIACEGK